MSTLKVNKVTTQDFQVGVSGTASNNFVLAVPGATPDGTMKIARGNAGATFAPPQPKVETNITKHSFWARFPQENLIAMQAILRSGNPALLSGMLGANQLMVSDSSYVDVSLQMTVDGVNMLASAAYPETITIDGTTLKLRLTAEQAAAILAPPTDAEVFRG